LLDQHCSAPESCENITLKTVLKVDTHILWVFSYQYSCLVHNSQSILIR